MGIVIKFPKSLRAVPLPSLSRHKVRIRVTDPKRPREARWHAQWPIQCAAGYAALDGFDTTAALHGTWHSFTVKPSKLTGFIRNSQTLLLAGRIEVTIDGKKIQPLIAPVVAVTGKAKRAG